MVRGREGGSFGWCLIEYFCDLGEFWICYLRDSSNIYPSLRSFPDVMRYEVYGLKQLAIKALRRASTNTVTERKLAVYRILA